MIEAAKKRIRARQADAKLNRIAQVYAEALLNAAEQQNQAREVLDELESIIDAIQADLPMAAFFTGGTIGRDHRAAILKSAFEGRASNLVVDFILVLNGHERLNVLGPAVASYRELFEKRANQVRVHVKSAVPLADDHRERLLQEIRDIFHREPVLEADVDPNLLGGMVVQVGDWLYDSSVRSRIETVRNQLIERSSHEIQAGRDRFSNPA